MSELKGFHACWWKLSWIIVAKLEPAAPVRLWYDNWSSSHQTKQGTEETETLLSIQCQTIKFGNFSLCTLHGGKLTNLIVQTSSFRTKLFSSPLWRCRYRRSFSRLNLCKKKKKKDMPSPLFHGMCNFEYYTYNNKRYDYILPYDLAIKLSSLPYLRN